MTGAPAARPAPRRPPPRTPAGPTGPSVRTLVLWPALITLAVTLVRLVGELRGWSPGLFSRLPGGGLSPLGITWLAPLVGLYLGWKLERAGVASPGLPRAVGLPAAALGLGWAAGTLAERWLEPSWTASFALWAAVGVVAAAVAFAGWPALGRPLLAYAVAARVPVALVMAAAVWKGWGTHYDAIPPGFPAMPQLKRWLWLALPQLTVWVAWTLATGGAAGALGGRAARWRERI